jgi:hypothetical protein
MRQRDMIVFEISPLHPPLPKGGRRIITLYLKKGRDFKIFLGKRMDIKNDECKLKF